MVSFNRFNCTLLSSGVYMMQFLSLLDSSAAFNCEIIRDCYEAFALYCFERYLIACLGMSKRLYTSMIFINCSYYSCIYFP